MTMINFWDCDYGKADHKNIGTDDEPDYEWIYHCNHPKNEKGSCDLDNKWSGDEDDCKLLDQIKE